MTRKSDSGSALSNHPRQGTARWWRELAVVPAAILSLLPSASCPICLAAYAAVLSSLGLGFLFADEVQKPLIVLFLAISVASIAWAARLYRRPGPLLAAAAGTVAILAGRIVGDFPWAVYAGVPCVIVAAGWNLILKRNTLPACVKHNSPSASQ